MSRSTASSDSTAEGATGCTPSVGSETRPQVDIELSKKLQGYKYFELLGPILDKVAERYPGADRQWRPVHHVTAYLFYFFNPVLTSLRGLQHATQLPDVQRKLKIPRVSLGAFSEAASKRVFDADLLAEVLRELVAQLPADARMSEKFKSVKHVLTAVDGTLLKAAPRIAWALWLNGKQRAAKAHVQFEVVRGVGAGVALTDGNTSERDVLAERVEAGRCYILDRAYVSFSLFQKIIDNDSSFVCRLRKHVTMEVIEERKVTEEFTKARVVCDQVVRLGGPTTKGDLADPVRMVTIVGDEFAALEDILGRNRLPRNARIACQQGGDLVLAFLRFQRADAIDERAARLEHLHSAIEQPMLQGRER